VGLPSTPPSSCFSGGGLSKKWVFQCICDFVVLEVLLLRSPLLLSWVFLCWTSVVYGGVAQIWRRSVHLQVWGLP